MLIVKDTTGNGTTTYHTLQQIRPRYFEGKDKIHFGVGAGGRIVRLDRKAIRATVRRIRPDDADDLIAIEREVARLQSLCHTLKATAWRRAHVVTLKELRAYADDPVNAEPVR